MIKQQTAQPTWLNYLSVLLVGLGFGLILTKSEVVSWYRIQSMFRFEEAHMYLIIISAIVVGAISLQLMKRFEVKTISQQPLAIKDKTFHKGLIFGGLMFGMGWAITGACPGPIYAQIGSGAWPALVTFGGAMVGMYLYAGLKPYLPH